MTAFSSSYTNSRCKELGWNPALVQIGILFSLVSYVEEMFSLWDGHGDLYKAPIKEEKKVKGQEERQIRSSILMLDLKEGKL